MKTKIIYTLLISLSFIGCENQSGKDPAAKKSAGLSIFETDLLDDLTRQEAISSALLFDELSWLSDESPAFFSDAPYSGWVKKVNDTNETIGIAYLKDGFGNGPFLFNYKNGMPRIKGYYKEGKKNGSWVYWDESGQTKEETY